MAYWLIIFVYGPARVLGLAGCHRMALIEPALLKLELGRVSRGTFYVFNEFTRVWSFADRVLVSSTNSAVTFFSSSPTLLAM